MLKPLLEDVASEVRQFGRPHVVIFSGDLVYGFQNGRPKPMAEQFADAQSFLEDLTAAAGCTKGSLPLTFVAGNHDVNRDSVLDGDKLLTDRLTKAQVEEYLHTRNSTWAQIVGRLAEWRNFVLEKSYPVTWDSDWLSWNNVFTDALGNRIGICGLNTAWASWQSPESGKLWIGERQAQWAWQSVQSADFRIAVTHHPISAMNEAERSFISQKVQSKFNMHLHGHEHAGWFSDERGHLRVEAGATYQGSTKPAAYSWIDVDVDQRVVKIRLRKWIADGDGGWGPFYIPNKTSLDGEHTTDLPFNSFKSSTNPTAPEFPRTSAAPTNQPFTQVNDGFELCREFMDRFSLEWEAPMFAPTNLGPHNVNLVYWPVKLRRPNVIHAAQAAIAAGLQQKGADVYLWLDDLGTEDSGSYEHFRTYITQWFHRAGGSVGSINIQNIRETLQTNRGQQIWDTMKKWFSEQQQHNLGEVLQVSKLLPAGRNENKYTRATLNKLFSSPPRKLLSPPSVWTCLVQTLERKSTGGLVTLGGIDEQPLWSAWRSCIRDDSRKVGHVYVSTLRSGSEPYDMDDVSAWAGPHYVENAITNEIRRFSKKDDWSREGGMIHWLYQHAIALPSYVRSEVPGLSWLDVTGADRATLPKLLSREVAKWLF